MQSVTLPVMHIHKCHTTVGPQCLSCWLSYLFWCSPKPNLSNELVLGQSGTDGVYYSGYLGWAVVEDDKHSPHFGSSSGFPSLLPVVFTEAILDKERAWKKQITLPHTGLLYQCSMSTVLPVECINVCACVRHYLQLNAWYIATCRKCETCTIPYSGEISRGLNFAFLTIWAKLRKFLYEIFSFAFFFLISTLHILFH